MTPGVDKLLYVKGCPVRKVLFPMRRNSGLWLNDAYVILSSPDDVDKALAKSKDRLCIGTKEVRGKCLKLKY